MGYLTISTNVRRCQTITNDIFSFTKTAHWYTCIVPATYSNWYGSLDFLTLKPCPLLPDSLKLNSLMTTFTESYSSTSKSCESKRLKTSRSNWLNSGNALIHHLSGKMQFSCFPILPDSAKARVIWHGVVKCLLIVYFIGNISAKNIKKCVHVCQS